MKVKLGLMVLMIGGLSMVLLAGCRDKRGSREWIENKLATELSRVYPTENVEDLFEVFPEGFEISQSKRYDTYYIDLEMVGDGKTKAISGNLKKVDRKTAKDLEVIPVEYHNGHLVFQDEGKGKEYWPYDGFLFQQLTINQDYFDKQDLVKTEFIPQNGGFGIYYQLNDKIIEEYLNLDSDSGYQLDFGGSESNIGYYYSLSVHDKDLTEFYFSELISD